MKFYLFESPEPGSVMYDRRYADGFAEHGPDSLADTPDCTACGAIIESYAWVPPHEMTIEHRRFPDVLWLAHNVMFTAELLSALEDAKITGIAKVHPPAVVLKVGRTPIEKYTGPPVPTYHKVDFARVMTRFDERASGFVRRPGTTRCEVCQSNSFVCRYSGFVFKEETWNGEDLFVVYGWGGYEFASERVKQLFDERGFTNVDFLPTETYIPRWADVDPKWKWSATQISRQDKIRL